VDDIIKKSSYANQNGYKFYKKMRKSWEYEIDWPNFNMENDFIRQGIEFQVPGENVKIFTRPKRNSLADRMLKYNGVQYSETIANEKSMLFRQVDNSVFAFCETYMKRFLVPRVLSNVNLAQVCKFRSKGRVPILSFVYKNNSSKFLIFQMEKK
jgi:hypothetical protein